MHSVAVTLISLALVAASASGFGFSSSVQLLLLTVLVAFLGVPHGALDPFYGGELLRGRCGKAWPLVFTAAYVMVGVLVIAGWLVAPVLTAGLFFVLAAWHFGMEEDYGSETSGSLYWLFATARGGLLIWTLAVCQPDAVGGLMNWVIPVADNGRSAGVVMRSLLVSAWVVLPVACWDLLAHLRLPVRNRALSSRLLTVLRVASFVALFAVVEPLVGFVVYFCLWHSIRGLRELREKAAVSWGRLVMLLAPITTVTLMFAVLAAWQGVGAELLPPVIVRTVMLGLSAIAIPHLALHAAVGAARHRRESAVPSLEIAR